MLIMENLQKLVKNKPDLSALEMSFRFLFW